MRSWFPIGLLLGGLQGPPRGQAGLLEVEFVFEHGPFARCHASTIAEVQGGLVAAWFAGTREAHADVGIWVARRGAQGWSTPVEVATGKLDAEGASGQDQPCWNPVLHPAPDGSLHLYYKAGPSPRTWWGVRRVSADGGATWSPPERLPEGFLGPIRCKPLILDDGDLLCPSSTEHDGWRVHFERFDGETWTRSEAVADPGGFGAIQPTLLRVDGELVALCRSRKGKVVETRSSDGGATWSALTATSLPNPNSGIDGLTLDDGRHLLVYNHTVRDGPSPVRREMLNVAVSEDGREWRAALVLESERGEFSYPSVVQAADGRVHVSYTWKRERIRHVVLDPARLELREMVDGSWPAGRKRER